MTTELPTLRFGQLLDLDTGELRIRDVGTPDAAAWRAVPYWLRECVVQGLTALVMARLPGAPAADAIRGTAFVWIGALCHGCTLEETRDAPRIRAAFASLLRDVERWPSPALLIKHLPDRPEPKPKPSATAKDTSSSDAAPWPAYCVHVLAERLHKSLRAEHRARREADRPQIERANQYVQEIEAGLRERPTNRPAPKRRRKESASPDP